MTVLSIPALIMAVIAFYVSGYHLLIYFRRPESRIDFTFALTAMCIGFYDVFCVALYNAASPLEGVQIQRWQLISLSLLSISYVWFVVDYTSMKSRSGPWLFSVIFLIFVLIGLFDKSGLAWTNQPLIKNFQFPFFGWDITYYEMEFGKAMLFEALMLMVVYLYLYLVAVHFYWKKNPKRAKPLVLAIGIFMLGMTEDVFVALGYYSFIYTIEFSFMGMILVMAYTLSSEIVERGKIQRELRESEATHKEMIANISDVIAIMGSDGTIKYKSPNIEKWFGWHPEDLVGTDGWETVHSDDLERIQKDFFTLLNKDNSVKTVEYRYKCKDGSYRMIELTAINLTNDSIINGVLMNYHDITERKQTEEELRESEERYRELVENAVMGFYQVEKRGVFRVVNRRMAEILGYATPQELMADIDNIAKLYANPEERPKIIQQIDDKGFVEGIEVAFKKKTGESVWVKLNTRVTTDKAGAVVYEGTLEDITEHKQMEEEHKRLEDKLQQAYKMEAIGTLAGGIAHDFNNILTPIIIQSELALMDIDEKSPIRFNLQEVIKAGLRAKDLVKQILTFSRQSEQQPIPLKITPIINEAIKLLRASLPTTIEIRLNLTEGVDTVTADPTQIHQVLMNLCTNAAHAMRETGGILEIGLSEVEVDSDFTAKHTEMESGPYLNLTVSDTGQGIAPDVIDRIFDPFFTTKDRSEGTGMGLAVVHGIIKSYGGTITIESELGKGTDFNVFLPRIKTVVSEETEPDRQLLTGNERILVVDDEKGMVDTLRKMLKKLGYQVVVRTSSQDALEAFEKEPDRFDLIFTDQTMPNMTGIELAKAVLSIRSDIPVILCTGFSEQVNAESAKAMGISAFVMKPIVMNEIANTIREVLDKK